MKIKWILFTLLILLSACDDLTYRYYTRINADGTVFKRIIAEGDSSDVYDRPFSFDVNKGWKLNYDKRIVEESGDTLFMAIAERTFESIDEVNESLFLKNDSTHKDNIKVVLKRQFAWFFTFHEYRQIYLQRFPFKHVSIDDYLTDSEYAYCILGDTTCIESMTKEEEKALDEKGESKFYDFLSASMGVEFISTLNDYLIDNSLPSLSVTDSSFVMGLFDVSLFDGPILKDICDLIDKRLGKNWISEAYNDGYFTHFEQRTEEESLLISNFEYNAEVEVPGLLYETNATSIEGNTAKWQFTRGAFFYKDLELLLKYRTINYWAFIVVGILIFIIVSSFYLKRKS
ncbi:hypothetical protein [Carboxylicivirga marina]|uniref:hypothetical protein n=1 Tax=Carboxylicivirga marina TaxID=2800988 RepID=UPI0025971D3C|nr:hypothetical protein [uncultured Carboxylicivirga sp.]